MKTFSLIAATSSLALLAFAGLSFAQDQAEPKSQSLIKPAASQSAQPDYVLELFTSQGCSSCPPANKFASELAQSREDVLVLSYGVTYWDYLGWKDTFGDPAFTQRQRDYGKSLGARNVYTPQMVLNGSAHSPRYSNSDVTSMPLPKSRPEASLSMTSDGKLSVQADVPANYKLSLIRYTPGLQEVAVKRGENGGRTLKIENVVDEVQSSKWDGHPLLVESALEPDQTYAAIFHEPDSVEVVTAAILKR
jgi:hypothetical protein